MKLSIPVVTVFVALISGCESDTSNETPLTAAEQIAAVPKNDARIVGRTCLDAVAARSGVARTELFESNYKPTSSGAQTTILKDPGGAPWECFTDSAGAITRITGPAT
jgi:hypothetical protein